MASWKISKRFPLNLIKDTGFVPLSQMLAENLDRHQICDRWIDVWICCSSHYVALMLWIFPSAGTMDPSGMSLHSINPYTFPAKLWCLVNTPEITAVVWNRGGDGILIDRALVESQVLSPTTEALRKLSKFRGIKFLSFVRQLHHYGFRKVQPVYSSYPSIHHFYHPSFKQNHPELLQWVRRQVRQHRYQTAAESNAYNQAAAHSSAQESHRGKSVLFSRERRRLILHTHTHTLQAHFRFI